MRRCCVLLAAVALFASTPRALADDYPPPVVPEAAKAKLIANLLRGRVFQAKDMGPGYYGSVERVTPGWCEAAFDAFRKQNGIVHVEPIARAERYDDPVFKTWQSRCPTLAMNASVAGYEITTAPNSPTITVYKKVVPQGAEIGYGTRNFMLYRVDLDNDPHNGEELIFYSERVYSSLDAPRQDPNLPLDAPEGRNWNDILPPQSVSDELILRLQSANLDGPFYNLLDLDHCGSDAIVHVEPRFDYLQRLPLANFSGIVGYQGRYYEYRIDRYFRDPEAPYNFSLDRLVRTEEKPELESVCWMQETPPKKN
jgi:hypothetical protein